MWNGNIKQHRTMLLCRLHTLREWRRREFGKCSMWMGKHTTKESKEEAEKQYAISRPWNTRASQVFVESETERRESLLLLLLVFLTWIFHWLPEWLRFSNSIQRKSASQKSGKNSLKMSLKLRSNLCDCWRSLFSVKKCFQNINKIWFLLGRIEAGNRSNIGRFANILGGILQAKLAFRWSREMTT